LFVFRSATNNRNQWEREGEKITENMLKVVEEEYDAATGQRLSVMPEKALDYTA
jgi:hypothetical protein